MAELLAPAGSMEALKAAIANGCDAVYLGMRRFGARAYSANFSEEEMAEATAYAHLRGVKVYATVNTIVFEDELESARAQLDFLNDIGVDGVICQDLAVLDYVASRFQDMEAHCSTQMGIDDVEGAMLVRKLGAARTVIGREVPLDEVKRIRREADLPVEAFIHGALCVSYSGNCIMSGMTGNRSGNRGRCIGSCRKLYDIFDITADKRLGQSYILSTKDLSTIDFASQLGGIDSLKIEGRMKEPAYVANVVSRYRMALDGAATPDDLEKLNRTFNRTYTKGYLFGEDRGDIANVEKPNNYGFKIGCVKGYRKGFYELSLDSELRQNDVIRIRHDGEDVNLSAAKLYDRTGKLINSSKDSCFIKVKERLSKGDEIYKTKDIAYMKELEGRLTGEYRRFPLDMAVYAYPGAPLIVDAKGLGVSVTYESDEPLSDAINHATDREGALKQLSKLNDTMFHLAHLAFEGQGAFVPVKLLNDARRNVVEQLCKTALAAKPRRLRKDANAQPGAVFEPKPPYLTAFSTTQEQYDACRACGIETVYFDNVVPRNGCAYRELEGELLIGGLGGIERYRSTNPFVADYSLNTVNSQACKMLHGLGAKRVTLSYEINASQIRELVEAYRHDNGGSPALEMIVYGHAPLLVTRYCPLKNLGQCGTCRTHRFELKEEHGTFPILSGKNCDTTILNGKVLNLLDDMPAIEGVEAFRLNFTIETAEEVKAIIAKARAKLDGTLSESAFNPETDTRGYYRREIL